MDPEDPIVRSGSLQKASGFTLQAPDYAFKGFLSNFPLSNMARVKQPPSRCQGKFKQEREGY